MLKGKTIILGVSGSIAAYKSASLASMLVKAGADVHVIMTENAAQFINPITFETLTNNRCLDDTFDRNFQYNVEHVALAKKADICIIAPASANVIAKMAHGIADDMLTTTMLACRCKKLAAPAMNTRMFENSILQENLGILIRHGFEIIEPVSGWLACRDNGTGKMPEPEVLIEYILKELAFKKDMAGKRVLITAGPTQEALDPVRFISNHSSGKMGYALARICMLRGAAVTLISGPTQRRPPMFVNTIDVISAKDMYNAVIEHFEAADIVIKAAAVADYRPQTISAEKIKKSADTLTLELEKTDDILKYLGQHKSAHQFLCGFAMETEQLKSNSRQKLVNKHLDMIVANSLKEPGAGFQVDTNKVTLITQDNEVSLELMSKEETAIKILDKILSVTC